MSSTSSASARISLITRFRWAWWLLLALVIMAGTAWSILLFGILPRIGNWRDDLAQQATKALGVTVRIDNLSGHVEGGFPVITFKGVSLLDERGKPTLTLPEVQARVSPATLLPSSIWRRELHMGRLVLVRPELEVRRDKQGRLHVAGQVIDPAASASSGSSDMADWLLSQKLIRIEDGVLTWIDEMRPVSPVRLSSLDVTLRNHPGLGTRVHVFDFKAVPPAEFGQQVQAHAELSQPVWMSAAALARSASSVDAPFWQRWVGGAPLASDWRTWSGKLAVKLPYADVQTLRERVELPVDVQGGHGRIAADMNVRRGEPRSLALDVDVQGVNVRLARELAPLAFRRLSGQIKVVHESKLSTLSLDNLAFTLDDGLVWPTSAIHGQWRHASLDGKPVSQAWKETLGGKVDADRLDLALLARLADRLPLSATLRQKLAELAPQGVGEKLLWSWDGALDAPKTYQLQGRIAGLTWAAEPETGRPGLARASVDVKADQDGGQATLAMAQGWLDLPGVFDEPRIPLKNLNAQLSWKITQPSKAGQLPAMSMTVSKAVFANDDLQGELKAQWQTGPGTGDGVAARFPGKLDMTGQLDWAQANRVWRYLPSLISKDARDYVQHAVKEGRGEKVSFVVRGDLWNFPFQDGKGGLFKVSVPVRNVTLDYAPAVLAGGGQTGAAAAYWPAFTDLDGLLVFEGLSMRIENATAKLGGLGSGQFALKQVHGEIANLDADDPRLTISGQGRGPLSDLLKYMAVSPVGVWTGNLLAHSEGSGMGALQLALDIPLNRTQDSGLRGKVTLAEPDKASLRISPDVPLMQAIRGQIEFTEKNLKVSAQTRVWGQEVRVEGQQGANGAPRFVAQGTVSAEGLRQADDWPSLARLATRMKGQSPVTVTVALPKGHTNARPELRVTSSLQGMAIDLPDPLTKRAEDSWPLELVLRGDDAQGHADALQVSLGSAQMAVGRGQPWVQADFRRDVSGDVAKVQRGVISVIQTKGSQQAAVAPSMPARGVVAEVDLPTLDLDAWQGFAQALKPASTSHAAAAAAGETYLPDTLSLKADVVRVHQRVLRKVSATVAHPSSSVWRAQIDADKLAGQIEYRPETLPVAAGPGTSRLVARLSRLSVPEAEAKSLQAQANQQMLSADASSSVPALDIVVDQFDWKGLPLGKLEIEAVNRVANVGSGGAGVPEWRLNKFRLASADAQLSATGNWIVTGVGGGISTGGVGMQAPGARTGASASSGSGSKPQHRAAFTFTLDLNNSGALLNRLGLPQTVKGGKGKLTGQVAWAGSPLEPDLASMNGSMKVAISEGQFLKVDPGAAKLLGVLSLQSLPRRLVLDFRDLFQQGFAFDAIDGDVQLQQGVAETRNLRMRGLQALVMMEGQADLTKETQDLNVYVVPEINAGAASLAYAAINPAVGLGTFLAQMLLRKQLAAASTREFHVTGPWADPQVEKVQRPLLGGGKPVPPEPSATPDVTAPKTPS